MQKPWAGRFKEGTAPFIEEFTESISFDWRLAKFDILQSMAHVRTLERALVLTPEESNRILTGLEQLLKKLEEGSLLPDKSLEDVHMNIETALTREIGQLGKKLHTARSRNDQVVCDLRLFLKEELSNIINELKLLRQRLVLLAKEHINTIAPSYTHLQHAQPIRLSHYFLAFREAFLLDTIRFINAYKSSDVLALGSGAVAGVDFALDRFYTASLLGFNKVSKNSIQATSDRDFVLDALYACAVCGMHLSRMAEDMIIWSSQEFNVLELPDRLCTGSSIMPQKKNPDVLELIRGKTSRLYANLLSVFVLLKGLPTAYNRDLQEDKEPLFDSLKTTLDCIKAMNLSLEGAKFNVNRLYELSQDLSVMTDLANYLVKKGISFRDAHEIVGNLCAKVIDDGISIKDISLSMLKTLSEQFEEDALELLNPQKCVDARIAFGSTGISVLERAIENAMREEGIS